MAVQTLYILQNGFITMPGHLMIHGDRSGRSYELPIPMWLIHTDHGTILFDTGYHPKSIPQIIEQRPGSRFGKDDELLNRLEALNLRPDQIDYVVISHLHRDHCGGVEFFPKAQLVIQKDEYAYGLYPHEFYARYYERFTYDFPHYRWKLIDGDEEIVPGVTAVLTNGHTPGHQSLLVQLPKTGPVLLAADACYFTQHVEKDLISGIFWNPTLMLHAVRKIKIYAKLLGAQVFPGHDPEFWKAAKLAPQCYT